MTKFAISKVTVDGILTADIEKERAKVNLKGIIEGNVSNETGHLTPLTITGTIQADSSKGNFAIGSGTFAAEDVTPVCGTIGILMGDDYQVIIAIWGSDEKSQIRDTYRFLEAISIAPKIPKTEVVYGSAIGQDGVINFQKYETAAELDAARADALAEWVSRQATDTPAATTDESVAVTEAPAEVIEAAAIVQGDEPNFQQHETAAEQDAAQADALAERLSIQVSDTPAATTTNESVFLTEYPVKSVETASIIEDYT